MKLLRVTAPHFVAGAIFEKQIRFKWIDGGWQSSREWRCVRAAPILRYLEGEWAPDVKENLQKKRYKWEWVPIEEGKVPAQREFPLELT